MPPQPTDAQLAARLNPTPTNITTPTNSGLWRSVGDNVGGSVYKSNADGSVTQYNLYDLGAKTGATGGGLYPAAQQQLKSQYGIDYSSLPTMNYGDVMQQAQRTSANPLIQGNYSDFQQVAPSLTSGQTTINNTPNSIASPDKLALSQMAAQLQTAFSQGQNVQTQTDPNGNITSSSQTPLGAPSTYGGAGGASQASPGAGSTTSTTPQSSTSPSVPQTSTSDSYLQAYLDSLKPSANETSLNQQLANLAASQKMSFQDLEGQPIAMPFITGQEAAVQKAAENTQQTLTQKLALEQAKRQSSMDVTKAMLDYNKPVSLGMGANLVNPRTGQTIAQGQDYSNKTDYGTVAALIKAYPDSGILPTDDVATAEAKASGSGSFGAKNTNLAVTKDAFGNIITYDKKGNQVYGAGGSTSGGSSGGYQAGQLTKLLQSQGKSTDDASLAVMYKQAGLPGAYVNDTAHNGPLYSALGGQTSGGGSTGGGGVTSFPGADAASLKQQTQYLDSTQRAFNTANQNLQALVSFMQTTGVNSGSNGPLINSLENKVKAGATDPGTIAAYHAALAGLRAEYAQVLSRGGEVTEGQRAQANSLIPDNLTPAQLQQVTDRLKIEGNNAINEANQQIQTIKNRVNGASSAGTSGGSSGGNNPLGI